MKLANLSGRVHCVRIWFAAALAVWMNFFAFAVGDTVSTAKEAMQKLREELVESAPSGLPDNGYGQVHVYQYSSSVAGHDKNVNVVLPPGYDNSKRYPVLFVLHGIFGDESSMLGMGVLKMIANAVAEGKTKDMLVVFPQVFTAPSGKSPGFTTDSDRYYDLFERDLLEDLLPWLKKNFSIAEGRENAAISGFSLGGRESLYIGTQHTDVFGFVGSICPTAGILECTDEFMHHEGTIKDEADFRLKDGNPEPYVLLLSAAKSDGVAKDYPVQYHNILLGNNVDHVWHVVTNGDHGETTVLPHFYNFARHIFNVSGESAQPAMPSLDVTIDDVTYPTAAVASVNVGCNATGTVSVAVGDTNYFGTVSEGRAVVGMAGLNAGTNKSARVVFVSATDNVYDAETNVTFNIWKAGSQVGISCDPAYGVGKPIVLDIAASGSAGKISLYLDGTEFGEIGPRANQTVQFEFSIDDPGSHVVKAVLAGDENYDEASASVTIEVEPKKDSTIAIDPIDAVFYSQKAQVKLSVTPADAVGEIVVHVDGRTYETTTDNPTVTVPTIANEEDIDDPRNLNAGHYLVRAEYKGNDEYKPSEAVQMLTVAKVQPSISIDVDKVYLEGDVAGMAWTITGVTNLTEKFLVKIDGNDEYFDYASWNSNHGLMLTRSFPVGEHCITTIYPGDRNHEFCATSTIFKFKPAFGDTSLKVRVSEIGQDGRAQAHVWLEDPTGYYEIEHRDVSLSVKNGVGQCVCEKSIAVTNAPGVGYVATVDLGVFEPGSYTVKAVNYSGESGGCTYGYEATATFLVPGGSTALSINAPRQVTVGEKVDIGLSLSAGASGEVSVFVDGAKFVATAGVTTVSIPSLAAGTHVVYARYAGDGVFPLAEAQQKIEVSKANTRLLLNCKPKWPVGETPVVGVTFDGACNPTGEVVVTVDGETYTAKADTEWSTTIDDNTVGRHIVSAYYPGDANNKAAFASGEYEVVAVRGLAGGFSSFKASSDAGVSALATDCTNGVFRIKPIKPTVFGGDATIEFELPAADATGRIFVTVNGVVYTNDAENLTLVVPTTNAAAEKVVFKPGMEQFSSNHVGITWYYGVPYSPNEPNLDLFPGGYLVTAEYEGDGNYAPATAHAVLTVKKDHPILDVKISVSNGVMVADIGVTGVYEANVNGPLDVLVDGNSCPISPNFQIMKEKLSPGGHTLILIYEHSLCAEWGVLPVYFEMPASGMRIDATDVYVGERAEVAVSVPRADADGDDTVSLYVKDGNGNYVCKDEGLALVYDEDADLWHTTNRLEQLDVGKYTVDAVSSAYGDAYASKATGTFEVLKKPASISIAVPEKLTAGDDATIAVALSPVEATGDVAVYVDGVRYTPNAATGKLSVPGITAGNHTVTAVYSGDSVYADSYAFKTLAVGRIPTSISVEVPNSVVEVGERQTVAISVSPAVTTDELTVLVDNKPHSVKIVDGKGALEMPTSAAGKCVVAAFFDDGGEYSSSVGTATFDIKAPLSVSNAVARQRWPWNGLVDVDYEIGGDPGELAGLGIDITFTERGGDGRRWVAKSFLEGAEPSSAPGRHRATWDTEADGVVGCIASDVVADVAIGYSSVAFPLWVGGVPVSPRNRTGVCAGGGSWAYDGDARKGTLTLHGAKITGTYKDELGVSAAIYAGGELELVIALENSNTVINAGIGENDDAVFACNSLEVRGCGVLVAKASGGYGIAGGDGVAFVDSTVTAVGGLAGVHVGGGLMVDGASTVVAEGTAAGGIAAEAQSFEFGVGIGIKEPVQASIARRGDRDTVVAGVTDKPVSRAVFAPTVSFGAASPRCGEPIILGYKVGETGSIPSDLIPQGDGKPVFEIYNTYIAKISDSGEIQAMNPGTNYVYITLQGGDQTSVDIVVVVIGSGTMPTAIDVDESFVLYLGESVGMGAVPNPYNAGELIYVSANTNVVAVSADGVMTAKSLGNTRISLSLAGTENFDATNTEVAVAVYPEATLLGDANLDGVVDVSDASAILAGNADSDRQRFSNADVNRDRRVDGTDANLVLGYYAYRSVGGSEPIESWIHGGYVIPGTLPTAAAGYAGGGNAAASTARPALSVTVDGKAGGRTLHLAGAREKRFDCTIDLSGVDPRYCSTGFHVFYSDKLDLVRNDDPEYVVCGFARDALSGWRLDGAGYRMQEKFFCMVSANPDTVNHPGEFMLELYDVPYDSLVDEIMSAAHQSDVVSAYKSCYQHLVATTSVSNSPARATLAQVAQDRYLALGGGPVPDVIGNWIPTNEDFVPKGQGFLPFATTDAGMDLAQRKFAITGVSDAMVAFDGSVRLGGAVLAGEGVIRGCTYAVPLVPPGAGESVLEYSRNSRGALRMDAIREVTTAPEGMKGFFVTTAGAADGGTGTLWRFSFTLSDRAQYGDVLPIDIVCLDADRFTNLADDASGRNMEAYLFTKGIYTPENPNPFGVAGLPPGADGYIAIRPLPESASSNSFRLDTRKGPLKSSGTESVAYSSWWHGAGDSSVSILTNGASAASGLTGEGYFDWSTDDEGTNVLLHVTAASSDEPEKAVFVVSFPSPVISNVVARQRFPWNGLVDIDYDIVGRTKGLRAEISFDEQGGAGRTWAATNFLAGAEPSAVKGHNRATWDANAAGATNITATVKATVRLVKE